jgi:hypothetical protein
MYYTIGPWTARNVHDVKRRELMPTSGTIARARAAEPCDTGSIIGLLIAKNVRAAVRYELILITGITARAPAAARFETSSTTGRHRIVRYVLAVIRRKRERTPMIGVKIVTYARYAGSKLSR